MAGSSGPPAPMFRRIAWNAVLDRRDANDQIH